MRDFVIMKRMYRMTGSSLLLTRTGEKRHGLSSVLLAVCVLAFLLLGSCSKSSSSGATGVEPGPDASLSKYLAWAHTQLRDKVPYQPMPEVTLPDPWTKGYFCFADRLNDAVIQCDYAGSGEASEVLWSHGPLDLAASPKNVRVFQQSLPYLEGPHKWIEFIRMGVPREKIGAIQLKLRVQHGRNFAMVWGLPGRLLVDVPGNDRAYEYHISTDGFADWKGPLQSFTVGVPLAEDEDVDLEYLRFVSKRDAYPKAVGVKQVSFSREIRSVLYAHAPATIRYDGITVPESGTFSAGLAVVGKESVRFRLYVIGQGQKRCIVDKLVTLPEVWFDYRVSLAEFAGQTISIELSVTGSEGAVACWANPTLYPAQKNPRRVLIYLIDALAAGHASLYGYSRPTTSNIDLFASGGVYFASAMSNATKTIESITNLFFSLYTENHGVDNTYARASDDLVSLAEVLRAHGFATVCVSTNVNAGPRQNLDQGFDSFLDHISFARSSRSLRTVPMEHVFAWLARHPDRPTFMYIHTAEPHAPYTPPERFAEHFCRPYSGSIDGSLDEEHGFQAAKTPEDVAHVIDLYDAEVAFADQQFGRFMGRMKQLGLADSLLTMVLADHGEEFFEHGGWQHSRTVYGELMRIPLVLVDPLTEITERRVDVPVQMIDIFPTILKMLGLPRTSPIKGDSVVPLLTGNLTETLVDRPIFASTYRQDPTHHAYCRGGWKLIYSPPNPGECRFELYDMTRDPAEMHDVLKTHPDIARELAGAMVRFKRSNPRFGQPETTGIRTDAEHIECLRELGYIK